MAEFTMPSLGADMDEGTLLEWLVSPGDEVSKGDVVAVVETAKSTIEVECFASGTVGRLLVEPGTTVPVGTPLATIGAPRPAHRAEPEPTEAGRAAESARLPEAAEVVERAQAPRRAEPAAPTEVAAPAEAATPAPAPAGAAGAPPGTTPPMEPEAAATPLVRRIATERGVDLASVRGTGPKGRVTRADVERATQPVPHRPHRVAASPLARRLAGELGVNLAQVPGTGRHGTVRAEDVRQAAARGTGRAAAAEPVPARREAGKAAAMRRSIAGLMARSNREIPHYYLAETIDLAAALDWMREHNRRHPVNQRLVPAALLLKAAALAARAVPELNGFWRADRFEPGRGVHLGVAVSLRGGGLLAPALRDADTLAVPELMATLKDLVTRARTGRLRGSETGDPTLTVTNLGDQGVAEVFGVIYPPQVALVGLGRVVEQPVAAGGMLGVRPCVTATLAADHRASDGATGARFLATMGRLLQNPEGL
jgi:pyruvate dehydrogenase E2 component (dihydrolipoamide acetyltransferase)